MTETMTESEVEEQYRDMLDEMYPLEGIHCNRFSILLEEGDPTAYDCGLADYSSQFEITED